MGEPRTLRQVAEAYYWYVAASRRHEEEARNAFEFAFAELMVNTFTDEELQTLKQDTEARCLFEGRS